MSVTPQKPPMPDPPKPRDNGIADGIASSSVKDSFVTADDFNTHPQSAKVISSQEASAKKEDAPKPLMITAPPSPEKAKESSLSSPGVEKSTAPPKPTTAATGPVVAAKSAAPSVAAAPKSVAPQIPSAKSAPKSEPQSKPEKPKSLLTRIKDFLLDLLKPKPKSKQKRNTQDGADEEKDDQSEEKDPLKAAPESLMQLLIKMLLAFLALLGIGKEKDEKKNKDDKKNATIESANVESPDNTAKNAPKPSANPKPTNVFQEFHQQSQKTQAAVDKVDKMFADLKGQKPNAKQASQPGDEFKKTTTFSHASHGKAPPKPNAAPKPSPPQAAAPKVEDPAAKYADFIKEKDLQKQLGDFLKDPSSDDGKRGYRQLVLATHSDKAGNDAIAAEIYKQVGSYKNGFGAKDAAASGKQPADAKSEKKETNNGEPSSELKESDFAKGDKAAFKEASSFLKSVNTKIESDQKLGDSNKQHTTTHKTMSMKK